MGMEYIPAFFGYRKSLASLTDEQFGRVIRAALAYAEDGEIPELDALEALAFAVMRGDIDRAKAKYETIAERNRANGMKGGRPRNPENPVGYLGTQKNPENPEEPKKPIQNKTKQDKTTQHEESVSAADAADTPAKRQRKTFVPPTVDEVRAYCEEQGFATISPEAFIDYYSANGWKVGSQSMKDWRATVRNWARRDKERGVVPKDKGSFDTDEFADAAIKASYSRMDAQPEPKETPEPEPDYVPVIGGKKDYSALWAKIM